MPLGDWQFWVVTALVVWAAWTVVRPFLPIGRRDEGCPGCGPPTRRRGAKGTRLTVEGERPDRGA